MYIQIIHKMLSRKCYTQKFKYLQQCNPENIVFVLHTQL